MKKGVPVSPGVAVAHAHCVDDVLISHEPYSLEDSNLSGEVSRFERACAVVLRELDDTFHFSESGNSEVLFAWLRIAVRHHYTAALGALERFLTSQGRRKFLKPLYEELMRTEWGKAEAKRIYAAARPMYHAVATATLDPIVSRVNSTS